MRKNLNRVKITGYVYQLCNNRGRDGLRTGVTGPNSKAPGTDFISGTIEILTDLDTMNVVPVHFTYVTPTYSSKKINRNYNVLASLLEDYADQTYLDVGENAVVVSIDGSLALDDFPAQDGSMVSTPKVEASFVSIVKGPFVFENKFEADMLITRATLVEADDEQGIKEHLKLRGCVFDYRNAILPMDFKLTDPTGIAYIENCEPSSSNPIIVNTWGKMIYNSVTIETPVESIFGEPQVSTRTKRTREILVEGAKNSIEFGLEETITVENLTKAMQDREVYLATVRQRAEDYAAAKAAPAAKETPAPAAAPAPKTPNRGNFVF